MILNESSLGVDIKKLVEIYKYATRDKFDFLLIDLDAEDDKKFRHNFLQIIS